MLNHWLLDHLESRCAAFAAWPCTAANQPEQEAAAAAEELPPEEAAAAAEEEPPWWR